MFMTVKRHEREKQQLIDGSNRLSDAVLKNSDQGLFLLDAKGKVLPHASRSLAALFSRQDFTNLTFEKLLSPLVTAKTLAVVRKHLAAVLRDSPRENGPAREDGAPLDDVVSCTDAAARAPGTLEDIEVRLTHSDGSRDTAHYSFAFDPVDGPNEPKIWLVRVTDITAIVRTTRELEELRSHSQTQGEILRGVLRMGGARFGTFLQRTDAAMKTIQTVLKKPAREEDAFRHKLEETLVEVDRMRREAAAFDLSLMESAARAFEDALHDLRGRSSLSGSDFLPLAVKLDQLYGQFALVKSLTLAARNAREEDEAAKTPRMTEGGTQIIEAPNFTAGLAAKPVPGTHRAAAGTLDSALQSMTEHAAHEHNKTVVLESHGLQSVPPRYQAAVKNVAVQLIRNAVMHGIESQPLRKAAGKAPHGTLRLEFKSQDDHFELLFEDDGCGLDPDQVRATAVQCGVVTGEAAARMRDREAIKLIFRSGFTTLSNSGKDKAHGSGMSLVRRYIHEAGGKIALASLPGHETRFKITLPALAEPTAAAGPQVARNS